MRVVLVPGWNENGNAMRIFAEGRRGLRGLEGCGFPCALFDGGSGSLTDRTHQLGAFIQGLRARDGDDAAPVLLFGYSAGGVLARAVVRSELHRNDVKAIFQLGAPNAGIVTDDAGSMLHRLHFSRSVIADLDLESDFMRRLNGTPGHWEVDAATGTKHWRLDRTPWVCAPKVPIFNLIGRVPQYGVWGDGVVFVDSATLDGHVRHAFVDDRQANHLNLSGTWNPLTLALRRWLWNDRIWPRAVHLAAAFFRDACRGVSGSVQAVAEPTP